MEHTDRNALPFPPRTFRCREHAQRLPPRVANTSSEYAPGADSPPSMQHMVEAITAAAIAAVDRHLAHMGQYPRSEPVSSHDFVNNTRPLVASASVATPPPPAGSVAPTTHPATVLTNNAYPASVATPPPLAGSVAPTTHPARFRRTMLTPLCPPRLYHRPYRRRTPRPQPRTPPRPHRVLPPATATSFAPALNGPLAPASTDERSLYDDSSSQASNTSSS